MTNSKKTLGVAMVGIGVGGAEMLPAFEQMPEIDLVAGADINPTTRERFAARYEAKTYDSIEALCEDPDVDAVWISTPNKFHAPHTIYALELTYLGRFDDAIAHVESALERDPLNTWSPVETDLGRVYELNGDLDGAMREWRRVLELDPDNRSTHRHMGTS